MSDAATGPSVTGGGSGSVKGGSPKATVTTSHPEHKRPLELSEDEQHENEMVRRARAALGVWQQLQATAATPSTVLVPGAQPVAAAALRPPPREVAVTNSSVA